VKRNALTTFRLSTAIESGKIKILTPKADFITKARNCAKSVGDSHYLSETDIEVLAIALQIREEGETPKIITDDYSIQNVASQLGINFVSLATFGIKRVLSWIRYCPACHRRYKPNSKTAQCLICGTDLKRKPQRTKDA
jgi:UPF0271 protein